MSIPDPQDGDPVRRGILLAVVVTVVFAALIWRADHDAGRSCPEPTVVVFR